MTAELTNLVRWEIFRLVRRAGLLVLASLVLLLGGAALTLALPQVLGAFPFPDKPGYFQAAAGTLASVAPLLAILLAALVHATDLQGGNCRTLAARGTSRTAILGAKFLTCSVALMAYYAAVLGMATLLALLFSPHFLEWREALAATGFAFLASLLYLALGILLAHWRQSVAFTVGVGIALIFVESIAYPIVGEISRFLGWPLDNIIAWTLWGIANGLQGNSSFLSAPWYVPIVAAYICLMLYLAHLLFHKLDLRAGSD